jgi:hypothetical protein
VANSPAKDAKRRAAAERARAYRERQRAKTDPEAYAAEQAAKTAAEQAVAEKGQADALAAAARAEAQAAELAKLTEQLRDALSAVVEGLAAGVQAAMMPPKSPALGNARARKIGEAWAPILAPIVQRSGMQHLEVIVASAATAGVVAEWLGEVRRAAAERKAAQAPRLVVTDAERSS